MLHRLLAKPDRTGPHPLRPTPRHFPRPTPAAALQGPRTHDHPGQPYAFVVLSQEDERSQA